VQPDEQTDLQQLAKYAMTVYQRMVRLRDELSTSEMTGRAGDGQVAVTLRGTGEAVRVRIDPAVADPDDVATLEGLLLAAIGDAQQAIRTVVEEMRWVG
jgi:nucleoid-associated protein EbfC